MNQKHKEWLQYNWTKERASDYAKGNKRKIKRSYLASTINLIAVLSSPSITISVKAGIQTKFLPLGATNYLFTLEILSMVNYTFCLPQFSVNNEELIFLFLSFHGWFKCLGKFIFI